MKSEDVFKKLLELNQTHLLHGYERLSFAKKNALVEQLLHYDEDLLRIQRDTVKVKKQHTLLIPLREFHRLEEITNTIHADEVLKKGEVACLILAGGQARRLNHTLPKALFPITNVKKKSLLQLFCEKIHAQSQHLSTKLPVAIMTSKETHTLIKKHLKEHDHFGLSLDQVDLFKQESLPLIDQRGNWILLEDGEIAEGPDGNGSCFKKLHDSGILKKWQERGVKYISIILIDNPLASPFDPCFVESHLRSKAEVSLKAVENSDINLPLGVIGESMGKVRVCEYSELKPEEKARFTLANTSLMIVDCSFAEKAAYHDLPWHIAEKSYMVHGQEKILQKCENFIFDHFEFAEKINVILYPKYKTFAPLKTQFGPMGVKSVQDALLKYDREVYEELSKIKVRNCIFELDPSLYFPSKKLLQQLHHRELKENEYVSFNDSVESEPILC